MKKTFLMTLLLAAAICTSAAEKIQLPVIWQSKSAKDQVKEFAMLETKDRVYFAFRIPALQKYDGKTTLTVSVYFDTDKNIATGREKLGCDFQVNVHLHRNNLVAMTWAGKKNTTLRFGKGDYTIERKGDVLAVSFNRAKLPGVEFKKLFAVRMMPYQFNYSIDSSKNFGKISL